MTKEILIREPDKLPEIAGVLDANFKLMEKETGVSVSVSNTHIKLSGRDGAVSVAASALESMMSALSRGIPADEGNLRYLLGLAEDGEGQIPPEPLESGAVCVTSKGKPVRPKTIGQRKYCEAMASHTITLGIGPAGTGKTYLAVAAAARAFKEHACSRIILTRPAIEAGEKLGFLPGDLQSKVDPYLRPLYDALGEMFGDNFHRLLERGVIEVAPLAYMRGRTLDDSFIILDEAQNTSREQMKMFLTRLGFNSKIIITGDLTQTDLPYGKESGLKEAVKVLAGIEDIAIRELTARDVVRHALVQKIVRAYGEYESKRKPDAPARKAFYRK